MTETTAERRDWAGIAAARPIDLDQIEARRKAAYNANPDPAALGTLVATDVPDMLAHLRAAQQPRAYEVVSVASLAEARKLAAAGWALISASPCGDNVWYTLHRDAGPLAGELDEVRAERDRLVQALVDEETRSAHYRDQADKLAEQLRSAEVKVESLTEIRDQLQELRAEERAERERLRAQVQQVHDARGSLAGGTS